MRKTANKPVGLTKNVGYEAGVRRTFAITPEEAWRFITSQRGLTLWLGPVGAFVLEPNATYYTTSKTTGKIRIIKPESHIRLTWQPETWEQPSTVQLRIIPNGDKAVISFHHEKLRGARERHAMLNHWRDVLANFKKELATS